MFLYVHKIREDMLKRMEKEEVEEKENQEEDLEEDFNDLVKQLLWKLPLCKPTYMAVTKAFK